VKDDGFKNVLTAFQRFIIFKRGGVCKMKKRIFLLSLILLTSCVKISQETLKKPVYITLDMLPLKDSVKQELKQVIDEEFSKAWYYIQFWVEGIKSKFLK
jgi:hypothetical protein